MEYEVEFVGHHIIDVEAKSPEEAEEKAIKEFGGFDRFDVNVNEIGNETE